MGEANARGDFDERRKQSLERQLDEAEVLVMLKTDGNGKLTISTLPRDEEPNQDSPPVIFAAYLHANFQQLAGEAMALYTSHAAADRGELPMDGRIMAAPTRSVIDSGGNIASGEVRLLGPDGNPVQ